MTDYVESDVPQQTGRTFLVTGANTGIGWDTARVLAERGARVLLGCRSGEKAKAAMEKIRQTAPEASLAWIELDLTSLDSVRAAADEVLKEDRLDGLINNAGVMVPPKMVTSDGFELQFGVNHLGHFALTGHLLPLLKDQDGARVVNVSSLAHRNGRIIYDDLHAEKEYSAMERYQMSKFANILFTYELQRKLEAAGSKTLSVACHPGGSSTELGRYINPFLAVLFLPLSLIMNSSAEGALPTLMATTSGDVSGGDYFGPKGMGEFRHSATKVETIPNSRDEKDAAKLWEVSTELTGVTYDF
ncbi:MAG: SDR family NAD(P)-dependent oxidoreductase [Gammaproteobacteria bacterium]|jgi:NAD(P)-dependent dehydrogenase (short-subunit alcohol dehydrogenase family)|nr:SDR family NAD(P)-dependent oxidoreductase [Gammaproteobacteria bacterium]